jgi:thiosulfate sulfurtransferase
MESFEQIDIQQAHRMISANEATVVDIRDEGSYGESHIPGAVLVNDANIREFLSDADRKRPVICYCYHGISSQSAAAFFKGQGFEAVYSMIGGFEEWRKNY